MAKPSAQHAGNPVLLQIGKTVRSIRKEKGISQEELALISSIDRSYLGGVERGAHNLTVITLLRLAEALDVHVSRLMQDQ
jgi:transcriptional regulator with XRE-family HTH domain